MFGDKGLQEIIDLLNEAKERADDADSRIDDVFHSADEARNLAEDARDSASSAVMKIDKAMRGLDALRQRPQPDLYTKLNAIDAATIQLQVAVDEMRLALKGGSDD